MVNQQADVIALANAFGLGLPIAAEATLDLAYDLTLMAPEAMSLMYAYVGVLLQVDDFTQGRRFAPPLPAQFPDVPLPPALDLAAQRDTDFDAQSSIGPRKCSI